MWGLGAYARFMRFRTTLLACVTLSLASCRDSSPAPASTPEFDQIYTVRGIIRSLKDPARPNSELQIHHEEIPEFVNGAGEASGMHAMTMPFPSVAPGVSMAGIEVGDKVRFTFGVVWTPVQGTTRRVPAWTITQVEELPADTALSIEAP